MSKLSGPQRLLLFFMGGIFVLTLLCSLYDVNYYPHIPRLLLDMSNTLYYILDRLAGGSEPQFLVSVFEAFSMAAPCGLAALIIFTGGRWVLRGFKQK